MKFEELFGTERKSRCGLSVAIPYLVDGITEETILSAVVNNYYFPILAGKLEVEVGEEAINADTFIDIARRITGETNRVPLLFVKQISDALYADDYRGAIVPIGAARLEPGSLPTTQIESMKSAFVAGNLVHLRIAVDLKPKGQPRAIGTIDLFLRSCTDEEEPFSLFSRGPIILPGERKYAAGIAALGAMIADSGIVAGFLGDAENAAHTRWSETAEKLTSRWEAPHLALRAIRHSLRDLYDMIAEQREMHDADALIDFFWLEDKSEAARGKPRRVRKPEVDVPPREAGIRINPKSGGFDIVAGPGAEKWRFPRRIRVRMAYDMIGADPFKRFHPFDFDLRKPKNVVLKGDNGDTTIVRANALYFDVTNPDFRLEATGFDTRRDLVVDARAL